MLVLRIPKEKTFINNIALKYRRNVKQGLMLGDVAYSDTAVYFMVPDEALSVAFLYSVYLKARERGMRVEAMYATPIDLDKVLPEDVKRVGEVWVSRRLSKGEINSLKNRLVTPSLLEVILK